MKGFLLSRSSDWGNQKKQTLTMQNNIVWSGGEEGEGSPLEWVLSELSSRE